MIPYGRQSISEEDIKAVVNILRSDYLTQGTEVPKFEQAVCAHTGSSYAVATNSGTSSLHLACLSLGLGPGDILWTSPITFVATANCAIYCGASIDFVDIDPHTFNMSIAALEAKLKLAEKTGTLPKVVIPVHLCGLSCDMKSIASLSRQYGFRIIEDACHAIGGRYKNKSIGSCLYSDITVFSFHPVKIITTAEGGMAVTNDKNLADKMALLRSHGITKDSDKMMQSMDGPWYYQQIELGYNYRMADIQAALGISQLNKLDDFVRRRQQIALRYNQLLINLPVQAQFHPDMCYSGMHLYVIRIQTQRIKKTHRQVFEEMRAAEIGVNLHYIPIHTQPYYRAMGFKGGDFPEAERYYTEAITLPLYPNLKQEQVDSVVEALKCALR